MEEISLRKKIVQSELTYDYLKDEVHILYEEKNELQQRIDKAIEYVSNLCNYANVEYYSDNQLRCITIRPYYIEKLLKTLKGDYDESNIS
jgi:hypothetical protein